MVVAFSSEGGCTMRRIAASVVSTHGDFAKSTYAKSKSKVIDTYEGPKLTYIQFKRSTFLSSFKSIHIYQTYNHQIVSFRFLLLLISVFNIRNSTENCIE